MKSEAADAVGAATLHGEKCAVSPAAEELFAHATGEAHWREVLESMPDGVLITEPSGRIVLATGRAEALFGYERGTLAGQPVEMLLPSRFRAAHPGHRAAYQAKPRVRAMGTTSDLWGQRADGTEFPVDLALGPLETDGGTLVSCVVRDITERKRAQRDLQEKNLELVSANQAKDRFLANMTHELRTPLNAILGFTGTLLMKLPGPLTAEQEKQLRTVQESATHLLELISTVLELSKIDIGGMKLFPEPVDLRKVVEEVCAVVAPLATARRIAVRTAIAPEAGTVTLDPRMFKQILFNLLTNAVKFSDVGACVDVAANRSDTGSLRLQVRDTGIGIAPGDLDKLFVEFQQLDAGSARRHEGTGLGLAITRGLVECQGGSIAVESAPGRGTTFTVVLPLRPGREGA